MSASANLPLLSAHLVRASPLRSQQDIAQQPALHQPAPTRVTEGRDSSQLRWCSTRLYENVNSGRRLLNSWNGRSQMQLKSTQSSWAEALLKIARMTLTIKRDGNWSSFQLANSALPLSVTSSAIAPSARMSLFDAIAFRVSSAFYM